MEKTIQEIINISSSKTLGLTVTVLSEKENPMLKCVFDLQVNEDNVPLIMYVQAVTGTNKINIHLSPFTILEYDTFYASDVLEKVKYILDKYLSSYRLDNSFYYMDVPLTVFKEMMEI